MEDRAKNVPDRGNSKYKGPESGPRRPVWLEQGGHERVLEERRSKVTGAQTVPDRAGPVRNLDYNLNYSGQLLRTLSNSGVSKP